MKRMYTTKEAAERLGLDISHVRRLLEQGRIKGTRFGKAWVVTDLSYQRRRRPKRSTKAHEG